MFSQWCNQAWAEFVAASYLRDHLRDGWKDMADATKPRW